MTFENVAYLFDSSMLGCDKSSSVYGVLSFVGNSLLIPAYAKETMAQLKFPVTDECELSEWLNDPEKSESLFHLLIKVYDDVEKLGITSFFIEKDYSAFIYLMGLMVTNIKVDEPDFRTNLDNLYYAYQSEYSDGIKRNNIEETVTIFNQRIQNILQTQKGHHYFKSLLSESGRNLSEQISVLKMIEKDSNDAFMLADNFFYTKQLMDTFREKEVHNVYASPNAGKRFSDSVGRFLNTLDVSVNESSQTKENYVIVSHLARILMKISNHYMGKIVDASDVRNLDETDKYLFVIVWMILHGGDNNMFINGRSYDLIKEVFASLKKDMSV